MLTGVIGCVKKETMATGEDEKIPTPTNNNQRDGSIVRVSSEAASSIEEIKEILRKRMGVATKYAPPSGEIVSIVLNDWLKHDKNPPQPQRFSDKAETHIAVVQARLGLTGKADGRYRTIDQIVSELADIAVAAEIAMKVAPKGKAKR